MTSSHMKSRKDLVFFCLPWIFTLASKTVSIPFSVVQVSLWLGSKWLLTSSMPSWIGVLICLSPNKLGLWGICLWTAVVNELLKLRCSYWISLVGCWSLWLTKRRLIQKWNVSPWLGKIQYVTWKTIQGIMVFSEVHVSNQADLNVAGLIWLEC